MVGGVRGVPGQVRRTVPSSGVPTSDAWYVRGLLGEFERKNGWTLAEAAGDVGPEGMQRLVNFDAWDTDGVRDDVRAAPAEQIDDTKRGVLIVDETGFLKKGTKSTDVGRQNSGTAGRIENSQIGVSAAASPAAFQPSTFASWASCSRRGLPPLSRSAYQARKPRPRQGFRVPRTRDTTELDAIFTPGPAVFTRPSVLSRPSPLPAARS